MYLVVKILDDWLALDERNSIGMTKSMALRKAAKIIHDSLNDETCDEMPWPPTPHDILEGNTNANTDLLNLILDNLS